MITFTDDGQYQDEYMAFMNAEIMPELRALFDKVQAYLDEQGATGMDYLFMTRYMLDTLELSTQAAYIDYHTKKALAEGELVEGKG